MSTYDELTGTAARIADAAIEWDMADRGWHKSDEGWISDMSVAPVSTYVLSHDGLRVQIVGEDGWLKSDEFAGTAETDFRAVWADWYERIFDLFLEWKGLPHPLDFEAPLGKIRNAISVINVSTHVSTTGASADPSLETSNDDLDGALTSFCGEILPMQGVMDSFSLAYSNKLPGVVRGQLAILGILGMNLAGEQNLFRALRQDLPVIADDVLEVMRERKSSSSAADLKIIGAVLAGASLFITGGTSSLIIANGRTIVAALSGMTPADEAPSPAQKQYGADTAMGVYENVRTYLDELKTTVRGEESSVRTSLTSALSEVTGQNADAFLLRKPGLLDASTQGLEVNAETLSFLGGVIAPFICDNLAVARAEAAGAEIQAPWERPDTIGLGAHGPYRQWKALLDEFVEVSTVTRTELADVGDVLIEIAQEYVDTESIIQQRLRELEGLDALDVPDFTPPPPPSTAYARVTVDQPV
ncbi:hypothetical protein BJ980_002033 [Nocardioides daedukensis]|uniref:Uncharacterized protein n=1 Tax=Nocardioides daedukensis TaxID=634462 RepID=A0A7Y9RZI4_9ACTN|nr:hypothetical protein [Nocardioides daedukensis]NYG59110.1 hypothetical protein [Nocardioides daedukensis]